MKKRTILFCWAIALGSVASSLAAYSVPWHTVDGGGGTSTSNDRRFSVSGTAGQPDAGPLMASNDRRFQLSGGFWYAEVSACGCTLGITLSGGNVVISWPCELGTCILEYTDELGAPGTPTIWHPVPPPVIGHTYSIPLSGTERYFRLRAP